jgi:hypothetical protein
MVTKIPIMSELLLSIIKGREGYGIFGMEVVPTIIKIT